MTDTPFFLLASNSPRRRELFALMNAPFRAISPDVDESRQEGEPPRAYVLRLAETKARAASAFAKDEELILAADTIVADGEDILGKPATAAEAESMLRHLRGRVHQVYTGIALFRPRDSWLVRDISVTDVLMRNYTDEEIRAYIQSGDPMDKAGAYAIQHTQFHPVQEIRGCYAGVMGLPLCHLARLLRDAGIAHFPDIAENCQRALGQKCSVFHEILENSRVAARL